MSYLLLLSFFISTAFAILPINDERFITSKPFKVASFVVPPTSYSTYISSFSSKKDSIIKTQTVLNSSTVLNLIPGLSLLQTDDNNECYFVNTTIGTDEYPLIIDTGSAYLWVYGDQCDDTPCENEALYTPASASSSVSATSTFALAYVTGSASGDVVQDNIIVNKLATTTKFKFGKANQVPDFFSRYPVSGIFGLPSNDSTSIESIISALYDSHAIGVKRFSISLGQLNSKDTNYPNAGLFAIGKPIEELYQDEIHYTSLLNNPSNYWLISIDEVFIDSFPVNFTNGVSINEVNTTSQRKAIIDSGTTVLALPKQDALDLHSYFTNSVSDGTNFAIYCNSTLDINLKINDKNFTIGPEQYLGSEYSDTSDYAGYCVSNIQGLDSSANDSWILGAVFLKTVYADFNVEDQQIGFAERNTNVILTSTTTSAASSQTTAAYYGNSTITTSSIGGNSSSLSSSSLKGDAKINTPFSIMSIITSFVALLLL